MKHHGKTHLLMFLLTAIWTFDAITVSAAVEQVHQITLLALKYTCAFPILLIYVLLTDGMIKPKWKDVPAFLLATLLGDLMYFYLEYTAYKYLSAGVVTVLICCVPAASYLTDCVVCRVRPNRSILLTILGILTGVALVVGNGFESGGRLLGYAAAFCAVFVWIGYGYVLNRLEQNYPVSVITLYQQILALCVMLPFAVRHLPHGLPMQDILICIVLGGILGNSVGFLLEVKGLVELGTTVTGIYMNFLPVFTAAAGFVFLHDRMSILQLIGAGIVILFGLRIIRQTDEVKIRKK